MKILDRPIFSVHVQCKQLPMYNNDFSTFRSPQHHSVQLQGSFLEGNNFCVTWSDGEQSRYHSMWLRHNCQCPECWDASSNLKRAAVDVLHGNPVITTTPVLSGKPASGHQCVFCSETSLSKHYITMYHSYLRPSKVI